MLSKLWSLSKGFWKSGHSRAGKAQYDSQLVLTITELCLLQRGPGRAEDRGAEETEVSMENKGEREGIFYEREQEKGRRMGAAHMDIA